MSAVGCFDALRKALGADLDFHISDLPFDLAI